MPSGDGVPHDDLKAFEYFSKIADENADESPDSPNAGVVANAFVALGTYFLDGIKGTYVKPNPARAHEMFHYAASYFGDANAQYNLARLYLEGTGVAPGRASGGALAAISPPRRAIRRRRRCSGHLLVTGQGGIPRQRAVGLMWLTLARAGGRPRQGPVDLRPLREGLRRARARATGRRALAYVEQYLKRKR